jgi:peptidoglycan-N-acetylglucosamine deacetylase
LTSDKNTTRILTFDLEDWYHLLDLPATRNTTDWERFESRFEPGVERILALLRTTGLKATFFCIGWMARKYPQVIRSISEQGFEIGCHSDTHRLVYEMTPAEFREDLQRCIASIEAVTGQKVRSYRAPGFSIKRDSLWAFEILARLGIESDSSVFPAHRAHGGLPGFASSHPFRIVTSAGIIKEFPMNTFGYSGMKTAFSGGGYFRLFPYPVIRRLTKRSDYVMAYFHPRDFDPLQPVLPGLSGLRKFRSYVGLRGSMDKFTRWMAEFDFTDMNTASSRTDWESTGIMDLRQ